MESIPLLLKEYGLKEKESNIYIYLVGKSERTAYQIAKALGLFRSTTYEILEKLIEKSFVSKSQSKKHTLYKANEISSVIARLKTKEEILTSLVPKLNTLKSEKPEARILEGDAGQKQYNFELVDLIKRKKITRIDMIGNSPPEEESSLIFIEKIIKEIVKSRQKKYGIYRGLWSTEFKNSDFMKLYEKFGENRFNKDIPPNTTTFITDNFVGFFFSENNVPYVIEIKSKTISEEMRLYFEIFWNQAKN